MHISNLVVSGAGHHGVWYNSVHEPEGGRAEAVDDSGVHLLVVVVAEEGGRRDPVVA